MLLHAIAFDGIRRSQIDQFESLLMAPGQRADVLVQAGAAGTYAASGDRQRPGLPVAGRTACPASSSMASRFRCRFPPRLVDAPLATIRDEEVTNTRRLTLSVDQPEFPPAANYQEFRFLVCGRTFDPNRVDQRIPLGAVEEWTIVNEHDRRPCLSYPHQSLPDGRDQWREARRAGTGAIRWSCRGREA